MTRPHRRTRPLPFGAVPWETSPHTARIGVDQDHIVARRMKTTSGAVRRYRSENHIPEPPPPDRGVWPSDDTLWAQNAESADRRTAEVRAQALLTSPAGWCGWDEEEGPP